MKKRALITGITGQDGSYLAEFLLSKGYEVYGLVRRSSTDPFMRLEDLYTKGKIKIIHGNMRDTESLRRALVQSKPHEIYNLAAQSHVGISFECPEETVDVNYHGLGRLVTEAFRLNPKIKIYQASTSEMYGNTFPPQNELSAFAPVSPYADAKTKAYKEFVVDFRKKHGAFICSGILFNHESPRRGKHFVTRKLTHSLSKIKLGLQDKVSLGNLDAKRDWGFAGDYVEAMWMMLQKKKPADYVISTGESRTVREFAELAAQELGMKLTWHGKGIKEIAKDQKGKIIIKVDPRFYREHEVNFLLGDCTKAQKELGWTPKTNFKKLVKIMVDSDFKSLGGKKR